MIGVVGLLATVVFGLSGTDISRHVAFGIFSTMVTLLAHSMMMFYFIGKGKAVKDALKANTDEVIARGGFGSPTIFVGGDDMYFGNDRLELVRLALQRRMASA